MTLSPKQQQRDFVILPTYAYDLEQQLLAMGQWWSRKGGVHRHLKGLQAERTGHECLGDTGTATAPASLLNH